MENPINIDFAQEVKADRLNLLWKATSAASLLVMAIAMIFVNFTSFNALAWAVTPLVFIVGCLVTRLFLNRKQFELASWAYVLGGVAAISVGLATADPVMVQILPFAFTVIVFVGGLLLPPVDTIVIAVLSAVSILLSPLMTYPDLSYLGGHQAFAIGMMVLAGALAAQVTGELYAITEWALLNYKRERRTNDELFESRLQLERSLMRSEALSDQLMDTNVELEKARAAAEAAKNFRGQFLANMSHEVRTPLNAIIGFSETMLKFPMMYDGVELPANYRTDLEQIHTSGRQLLTLINDILDLAKIDAGKLDLHLERVEIKPITDMVLATANGLIGPRPIMLKADLPPTLPDVMSDSNRLRQILLNLYSNAVKFTDQGEIMLTVRETAEGVQFSVKDTGVGIPLDQQDAIFEEFQQAGGGRRDPRAGAGLGLTISRQLVMMMKGRIWVESTPGLGSTFHFVVPAFQTEVGAVGSVLTKAAREEMVD